MTYESIMTAASNYEAALYGAESPDQETAS